MGVLGKPEEHNVTVENVSPSFLVNHPDKPDSRFVTAFNGIAQYAKTQPSMMSNVDSTLRTIAGWRYIIQTDLKKKHISK